MREGESLVDERPGGERSRVQLARREKHLAVLPVDPVAVVVHRDEVVVGTDLLQLPERLEQRVAVPQPDVVDGRPVGPDVPLGEPGLASEVARHDAVQPPGPPRRDRKSTRLNSSHGYISYA